MPSESESAVTALLAQVRALGYQVSVFELGPSLLGQPGSVELHAVDDSHDPPRIYVVNVAEGEGDDPLYVAACELASQVGIDLEG